MTVVKAFHKHQSIEKAISEQILRQYHSVHSNMPIKLSRASLVNKAYILLSDLVITINKYRPITIPSTVNVLSIYT